MTQPNDYLAGLNNQQRQAVEHKTGPLLIVAGAGTGKTTVLVNRLLHLITSGQAKPEEILLATFTEKAAGEMEERADRLLPYGYTDSWIQTFHSLGERLLRQHGLDIGLPTDFKLLNETAQWILLRRNLDRLSLDYYRPLGNETKFLRDLIKYFSHLKDEDISPADYLKFVDDLDQTDLGEPEQLEIVRLTELAQAYQTYNQLLLDNSYLDFGDLITYTLQLFRQRPNILELYRRQFKFILVDEFQDTNWSQYKLIKLLAAPNNNLTVVGDDDQSIYKFRGASLANILQFKDDFPKAREVVLTANYRSGQPILDQAYRSIQNNNPDRLEVKLKLNKKLTAAGVLDGTVETWSLASESEEIITIVDYIKDEYNRSEEIKWSDFSILIRSNREADKFINEFVRQGIPCQFMSMRGLYYKPIILDCLAYFKLLDHYHESAALYRVFNSRPFLLSATDLVELSALARRKAWSLFEAAKNNSLAVKMSQVGRETIDKLMRLINEQSVAAAQQTPSRVFVDFVYRSGLLAGLDQDADWLIFHYLNQFYKKIKDFENTGHDLRLKDFVDLMDLEMEAGETGNLSLPLDDDDVVKIMTIHSAKGLEFKYVILPDLIDKKFPTVKHSDSLPVPSGLIAEQVGSGDTHLAEERRLFYVAITRAKEKLILAYARDYGGARERRPSVFLKELGLTDEVVERQPKPNRAFELVREVESLKQPIIDSSIIGHNLINHRFSFSQLEGYSNCPLQYKFAFILRVPVPEKANMIYGRLMHRCLYELFLPCLISDQPIDLFGQPTNSRQLVDQAGLLAIYSNNWVNEGYASTEEREKYRQLGRQSLATVWQTIEKSGWPNVLALEKKFVWKTSEFIIHGTIDRIDQLPDGSVEIIDYKTGRPKEKLDYQAKRQLMLYQLAVEEVFGWRVSRLSFYYLNNGTIMSFEAKPKDLDKIRQEVISEIKSIKQGFFPAQPSQLCSYCDFRSICQFRRV